MPGAGLDHDNVSRGRGMTYKIQRTRLITEVFRIEADNEEDAIDMLGQCDTVVCQNGVEQIDLSTLQSEVEIYDEVLQ